MKFILIFILSASYLFGNWTIVDSTQLNLDSYVRFFYLDINDNIWLGTASPGKIYNFDGIKTEYYDTTNTPLAYSSISCITQGPKGDMYFGTYEDNTFPTIEKKTCLIRFDGENWEYFNQHNSPMHPYSIRDILVTGNDEFWVATVIGLFHYKEGTWKSYFEDENDFRREIRRPAIDKNNNLYITNILSEVYSANLNNSNVKFNKIETLSTGINVSTSCFVDSLNNLWLENRRELHKRKNANDWIVYDSTHLDSEIHRFSFYISRTGKIFTNNSKAVYEYKDNTNWEKIFDIPDSIFEVSLRGLDSKGNFWFSSGNKLIKYTPEHNSVKRELNISIYPNPSQSKITVNTDQQITELALYTINLTKVKDYTPNHKSSQEIDISNLSSGVYFIKVNDDFIKFVKE